MQKIDSVDGVVKVQNVSATQDDAKGSILPFDSVYLTRSEFKLKLVTYLFMIDPAGASSSEQANVPVPDAWNYEATVAKVEAIIEQIEAGQLELADVFDQFAVAVEHLRQCENFLSSKQQQRDLLIERLADEPDSF